jgi:hypothetical protein
MAMVMVVPLVTGTVTVYLLEIALPVDSISARSVNVRYTYFTDRAESPDSRPAMEPRGDRADH